jgi:hypothetical protein
MATPSNTDVQGFLTAALGVRDAWSNLNPNDPNSRAALASAIIGLAASVTTPITDNPRLGTWANRLGVGASLVSLSANVNAITTRSLPWDLEYSRNSAVITVQTV